MIHRFAAPCCSLLAIGALVLAPTGCFPGPSGQNDGAPALSLESLRSLRFPPVEPAAAPRTFQVQDGFRMELIAAEPLVYDPVAMVYDENGRAYVAEMSDYPYTDKETASDWQDQDNQAPIGRIRLLEDEDGDGVFDRSTIFAEGLSWPTGLGVWQGGVYVTATPDIWYLKDTDGDGRADVRELTWTGFRKFNVQGVINNLTFGLDHRFYGAGASNGGEIRPGSEPDVEPVELGRNDFRFHPVSGRFEVISGGARFGNTFDDWGNRFIAHIRNPVQHVVLPDHYLRRNSYLPVPSAIHDAAEAGDQIPVYKISPPEPWRALRARRLAADPEYRGPRSESRADGTWTSSSGITIYRGDAYPEEYRGNVFVGEVANNVVHRQKVSPDGVTFRSVRADPEVEFVASTDTWFRGVNLVNAPDGTLHVLDMYREVIEHPWSIPEDIHAQIDLLSGTDRGRIYRLSPPDFRMPRIPRLGEASTVELVAELESGNGWRRDTAHRLLFERQDRAAVEPLRRLLRESTSPLARMHALWSLHGVEALREQDLLRGLSDASPGVREHAVRMAEGRLATSPSLLERVVGLAKDPEVRVRFQVAFTLGEVQSPQTTTALAEIARRDAADPWVRTAVLSSAAESSGEMLLELLGDASFTGADASREMIRLLAAVVGARQQPTEVGPVLSALAARGGSLTPVQIAALQGLGEGLESAGTTLRSFEPLLAVPAARFVAAVLEDAPRRATDDALPVEQRIVAIQMLAYEAFERSGVAESLSALLDPRQPPEVQMAAVHTLSRVRSPRAGEILLERWRTLTPQLRTETADVLLTRPERIRLLLDAVEAGDIPAAQISLLIRTRLTGHRDPEISSRARALFATGASGSRERVIDSFQPALSLDGERVRGKVVFQQNCMACHRFGGDGVEVGPNLMSVRHKTPEEVLALILDPNREVSPEYVLYQLDLRDGRSVVGIIAAETAASITLQRPGGLEETILRSNIARMASSGISLMPEGLEAAMDHQAMADLLEFLLR